MTAPADGSTPIPAFVWRLLLAVAILLVLALQRASAASCVCAEPACRHVVAAEPPSTSWIFRQSRYTHDPETGFRVAQYDPLPSIEPLADPRLVTSGYSRSRTVLRGPNGTVDTSYQVRSYGNGRGGLDAEWERFHDAWRGSTVGGGGYQGFYGAGGGFFGGFPPYAAPYDNVGPGAAANGPYGRGYGPGGWYGRRDDHDYRFGGFSPADRPPLQGPIDPDGANGYDERREPFPRQRWPWELRRRELHRDRDQAGRGPGDGRDRGPADR